MEQQKSLQERFVDQIFLGDFFILTTPKGIRIPVTSVKGRCPRPLDDGGNETCIWKKQLEA